jgi:WD40 repeat protein
MNHPPEIRRPCRRHSQGAAAVLLGVSALVSAAFARAGDEPRQRATERAVEGLRLVIQSTTVLPDNPGQALLLALEGARRHPGPQANNALFAALEACDEERTLRGHEGEVAAVAWSHDGKRVVSVSSDKTAHVWDAATGRVLHVLAGPGDLAFAGFTLDDRRLVTVSTFGRAQLWDAASGRQLGALDPRRGPSPLDTYSPGISPLSARVDFSPDGRRVLTALYEKKDDVARLWDADTGQALAVLKGHDSPLQSARFSPDGRRVVTTSLDRTARVWDAATGKELLRLNAPSCRFSFATFSPDGRQILTTQSGKVGNFIRTDGGFGFQGGGAVPRQECAARLWDADTGKELVAMKWPPQTHGGVGRGAFSRDGRRVLTAGADPGGGSSMSSGNTELPRVWDAATGKELVTLALDNRGGDSHERDGTAAFSPDGRRVLTVQGDRTARLWDAATGTALAVLRGHEGSVVAAAFSPDGGRIVTASGDHTARVWHTPLDAASSPARGHWFGVSRAIFSRDGRQLLTVGPRGRENVRIRDAATGREVARLPDQPRLVQCATFSPDGKLVALGLEDEALLLWEVSTGKQRVLQQGKGEFPGILFVDFSPDGRLLLATVNADEKGAAHVWETATGKEVAVFQGEDGHPIFSAAFSPDGRRLLTRCYSPAHSSMRYDDAVACIGDVTTGKRLLRLEEPKTGVRGGCSVAVFSPDGKWVLTARDSNYTGAHLWDGATGKHLRALGLGEGNTHAALFSPDGRRVLTVPAHRNFALLWDAATGEKLLTLPAHESEVRSAAFHPDGRRLLTASRTEVRVRDAATGKEVVTLRPAGYEVWSAEFSPDGRWVRANLVAPEGRPPSPALPAGEVRLWPVDLVAAAEERKPRELTPEERQHFEIGRDEP